MIISKGLNQQFLKEPWLSGVMKCWIKPTDFTVHTNQTWLLQDWRPKALHYALQSIAATPAKEKLQRLKNT